MIEEHEEIKWYKVLQNLLPDLLYLNFSKIFVQQPSRDWDSDQTTKERELKYSLREDRLVLWKEHGIYTMNPLVWVLPLCKNKDNSYSSHRVLWNLASLMSAKASVMLN